MDVKLRSRSGLKVLQDIRNSFHEVPVILTTAYPALQLDPKSVGSDVYLTKTSDLTILQQQIEKCLATPSRLEEKGILPGENAKIPVMEPAVQLGKRSTSRRKGLGPDRYV